MIHKQNIYFWTHKPIQYLGHNLRKPINTHTTSKKKPIYRLGRISSRGTRLAHYKHSTQALTYTRPPSFPPTSTRALWKRRHRYLAHGGGPSIYCQFIQCKYSPYLHHSAAALHMQNKTGVHKSHESRFVCVCMCPLVYRRAGRSSTRMDFGKFRDFHWEDGRGALMVRWSWSREFATCFVTIFFIN